MVTVHHIPIHVNIHSHSELTGCSNYCSFGKEVWSWYHCCGYGDLLFVLLLAPYQWVLVLTMWASNARLRKFKPYCAVIDEKHKETLPEHETQLSSIRWHLSEGLRLPTFLNFIFYGFSCICMHHSISWILVIRHWYTNISERNTKYGTCSMLDLL